MPSRKRNKGQARKAKVKSTTSADKLSHRIRNLSLGELTRCRHGAKEVPDECHRFINTFYQEWSKSPAKDDDTPPLMRAVATTLMEFQEVWRNKIYLEAVKAHLVSHGTEMILQSEFNDAALELACAIITMDNYDPDSFSRTLRQPLPDKEYMKNRDLSQGCGRSLVQFYSKRIPCSCLDKKYAALKAQRKTGVCTYCEQRKEHSRLMMCSQCRRQQYCSKECQVAHWTSHKEECEEYSGKLNGHL